MHLHNNIQSFLFAIPRPHLGDVRPRNISHAPLHRIMVGVRNVLGFVCVHLAYVRTYLPLPVHVISHVCCRGFAIGRRRQVDVHSPDDAVECDLIPT